MPKKKKKKKKKYETKRKLKLSKAFMCRTVLNILGENVSQNHARKLYQVIMYNFLCQND